MPIFTYTSLPHSMYLNQINASSIDNNSFEKFKYPSTIILQINVEHKHI